MLREAQVAVALTADAISDTRIVAYCLWVKSASLYSASVAQRQQVPQFAVIAGMPQPWSILQHDTMDETGWPIAATVVTARRGWHLNFDDAVPRA
jgi:hypothetical protein